MRIRGVDLYVEEQGSGPPIVFSHGLLWSGAMFDPQVSALYGRYRCIRYDHRGQGRSAVPSNRIIGIETVYDDAVSLIEALGVGPCHFVGLSMGGFVGMRIAARRPDLLKSLVLVSTAADAEPRRNLPKYLALNQVAKLGGMSLTSSKVMEIMFGRSFMENPSRRQERAEQRRILERNRPEIHRAVNGVISRRSFERQLRRTTIHTPTLILHGREDRAIAPRRAEALQAAIGDAARLVWIPGAGHTCTIENPDFVNHHLGCFIDDVEHDQEQKRPRLHVRSA